MIDLLENLGSTVQDIIIEIGYLGITIVMFLENVFPPIPSELVLPFAGFLVGRDELNLIGVWLASLVGSLVGAIVLYYLGQWAGDHVVRNFLRRYGRFFTLSERDYDRVLHVFDTRGEIIVFVGRLIPIIRSLISLPAGANHMPMQKFLLYTTLGAALWNGILIYAGMTLGNNWEQVMEAVAKYQYITIAAIVISVIIFVGLQVKAKLTRQTHEPSEI